MEDKSDFEIELSLLVIYFALCNQYGKVDMAVAKKLIREKLNIEIPYHSFTVKQVHIDLLSMNGIIPDISAILEKAKQ